MRLGKRATELGLAGLVVPNIEIALRTAEFVARRSSCVRGQIGALALDRLNTIVGVGWNIEKNGADCGTHCPRAKSSVPSLSSYSEGPGKCISTHAEAVALADVPQSVGVERITVLVVSYTPCPDCQAMLSLNGQLSVISGTRRTVR